MHADTAAFVKTAVSGLAIYLQDPADGKVKVYIRTDVKAADFSRNSAEDF